MRGERRRLKIKRLAHPVARVAHSDLAGGTHFAPRRVHKALRGRAPRLVRRGLQLRTGCSTHRNGEGGAWGRTVPREHSAHTTRPHARQWWRPENRFRLLNWVPQPAMAHSNASLSGCQYFLAICRAGRAGDALHAASRLSCARGVVAFNSAACSGSPGEPTGWLAAAAASWTIVSAVLICRRPDMLLSGAPCVSFLSVLSRAALGAVLSQVSASPTPGQASLLVQRKLGRTKEGGRLGNEVV